MDPRDKVRLVKVQASERLGSVADPVVQVFGGYGFTKDLHLERIHRDARVTRNYDGTSEVHRMIAPLGDWQASARNEEGVEVLRGDATL